MQIREITTEDIAHVEQLGSDHYAIATSEDNAIANQDSDQFQATRAALRLGIRSFYPDQEPDEVIEAWIDNGGTIRDAVWYLREEFTRVEVHHIGAAKKIEVVRVAADDDYRLALVLSNAIVMGARVVVQDVNDKPAHPLSVAEEIWVDADGLELIAELQTWAIAQIHIR